MAPEAKKRITRRQFLTTGLRDGCLMGLGGVLVYSATRSRADGYVWQLDPDLCIGCGNCQTRCVLKPSAVKCVHAFAMCGYCEICYGYFNQNYVEVDTAAENQLCPTNAIIRSFPEKPYYEYQINEPLCIGCAKCVLGCRRFGNGSLFLQAKHDRCLNCNECAIAISCPGKAWKRVPRGSPYLLPKKCPTTQASKDQQGKDRKG